MAELGDVTDQSFDQEVIQSDIPVIVDFWGEHCAPCKVISPILSELAGQYQGRIKVVKLDSDTNGATMVRFHVMALPTVLLLVTPSRTGPEREEMLDRTGLDPADYLPHDRATAQRPRELV